MNGRNFANLMTLSPGATSDGNGGWSSIRFNGKSNQQNYLNYDGVDGTYVWDASPGYLNATGSQFRLQTSMESVAEFRVNAGLSPAESGLGTGGNITVVTKSGANKFTGSLFEYYRDDALDATNKYDDIKQPLRLDQFGGSIGGPIVSNKVFFFGSYEGLRQDTGLSFVESVPSNVARRPDPGRRADDLRRRPLTRADAGGVAAAGTVPDRDADLVEPAHRPDVEHLCRQSDRGLVHRSPRLALLEQPEHVRSVPLQRRRDRHARPVGDTAPGPCDADAAELRGQLAVDRAPDGDQRVQVRLQPAGHGCGGVRSVGLPRRAGVALGRGRFVLHRRSWQHGHRTSGLQLRATSAAQGGGSLFEPASFSFTDAITMTRGTHTFKAGGEYRRINVGFQFLGGDTYEFNSVADFIDNRPNRVQRALDSPEFDAQQQYAIAYVQDSWRPTAKLTLDLGLRYEFYSVVNEKNQYAIPFFIEENDFSSDPDNFYEPDYNNIGPRLAATYLINDKTVLRGGLGWFYGPGQFEDRIQPIENYITRYSVSAADVANNGLQYPVSDEVFRTR